jgi:hypothetical protein
MQRYLLFDAQCSVCRELAAVIQDQAMGKLQALSLCSPQARDMLAQAFPNGWAQAPYLVTVKGERVQAWKGIGLALRLAWLLGTRKAWNLSKLVAAMRSVPAKPDQEFHWATRRQFMKASAFALTGAVFAKFLTPDRTRAGPDCATCDTCGETCYLVQVCVWNQGCLCDKYRCVDSRTGEFCYFLYDCGCCGPECQCA